MQKKSTKRRSENGRVGHRAKKGRYELVQEKRGKKKNGEERRGMVKRVRG